MSCDICSEEVENKERINMSEQADAEYNEYLYDHYLDLDERLLREMEEN
jgi:hypothetical protein